MKKGMPRVGKRITTPEGEGKVIRQNVMEKKVVVALTDGREIEYALSQLEAKTAACRQCGARGAEAEGDLDRG
jgi:hypothetical protein